MPCLSGVNPIRSNHALAPGHTLHLARGLVRWYNNSTDIGASGGGSRMALRWVSGSRSSVRQLTTSTVAGQGERPGRGPLRDVPVLPSWDSQVFGQAFKEGLPVRLPRSREHLPHACSKWFIHDGNPAFDLFGTKPRGEKPDTITSANATSNISADPDTDSRTVNVPKSSELRPSFWQGYKSTIVALEVTTRQTGSDSEHFERLEGPLEVLLAYLSAPQTPAAPEVEQQQQQQQQQHGPPNLSIYLAQSDLSTLPATLQEDVPIPTLLRSHTRTGSTVIKGDIYASSLWMGRPPTYTPLHRDPNPNLFIQLAGQKTIRLLPPELGDAMYHDVMSTVGASSSPFSTTIRGAEMMVTSPETRALHDCIWDGRQYADLLQEHCRETTLGLGEALFTPKGWWHSVKGVGAGVTASVNWWFR
ncbi:hypothetical protein A1O7_06476 [Cladophialophora yegresii CBS 114405]|uniref:JmjC domain-containing protein n=1 Tax=Cladophialophora yegresii CBS 114405 TaxID=1182544 RepID=W9W228_9EURO|nr:uncharacterized protein A1O7_06476 [Cladophialophora yegresii CBS 114405]EXJ59045.1 hypothetical protein A1O7_06476 [Cladophialophora yegresii CBS 114405]